MARAAMDKELSAETQTAIVSDIEAWRQELRIELQSELEGSDDELTDDNRLWNAVIYIQGWGHRITGTKETMDRPAWSEMLLALHGNGMRTIIIERLDRLARELMV
jgi:hypothetical protein